MALPSTKEELRSPLFWRDMLCEFLVTFFLLAFHVAAGLKFSDDEMMTLLKIGLPTGLLVFALIEAFGHISGAHMNPAVTLGFLVKRDITVVRAIFYLIGQLAGGIAGSALTYWLTPVSLRHKMGPLAPSLLITEYQALVMEIFLTATLMVVVCGATDEKNRKVYMASLPIGCTVAVNISLLGNYTGSSMNPALSFGPSVVTGKWRAHWVYWVGPLVGSALATVLYKYNFILLQEKFGPESKRSSLSEENGRGEDKMLMDKDEDTELRIIQTNGKQRSEKARLRDLDNNVTSA